MPDEKERSGAADPAAKTILIVEDDEDTLLLYSEAISFLSHYHILIARNQTEALHLAEHIKPDLCIIDYRLPHTNGIQLYNQLHALPTFEHIPAMLISATSTEQIRSESESRKLIYMEKPFELDEFLHKIEQVFSQP